MAVYKHFTCSTKYGSFLVQPATSIENPRKLLRMQPSTTEVLHITGTMDNKNREKQIPQADIYKI